jgi:hypothetical protein
MKPEELLPHGSSMPWQGLHYITKRVMDSSLVDSEVLFWIIVSF